MGVTGLGAGLRLVVSGRAAGLNLDMGADLGEAGAKAG